MRRVLVTGGTCDDVAPIATFIINISKTNSHLFDEIIVYHNGIKAKDQELIKSIYNTRFIKYEYNPKNKNDEVISYFTNMVFCKYECFALLSEYDEVIWSDYDVVVKDKLDDFCRIDGSKFNVLTCDDSLRTMFYEDTNMNLYEKYDMDTEGVGTPLFALSNKLESFEKIYQWCYEKTTEWCDDLYLPEQCIFSLAVQEFGIELERFSFAKYACHPSRIEGNEVIIHAAGQPKFWNGIYDEDWMSFYSEWIKLGGTPYREWRKKLKRKYLLFKTRLMGIRHRNHG